MARIDELPIQIVDVDRTHALAAAHLKAQWPAAYADCFAAALAQLKGAALVTGDAEFRAMEPTLKKILWLGEAI